MNSRCVIVGAAKIGNINRAKSCLAKDDFFIFCDGGLNHRLGLGVNPDLVVGDFDSFDKAELQRMEGNPETITLPREKDDTDVFFAVKEALKRGYKDFLLLGVIGERFDHSLVNISVLIYLHKNNCSARIVDDYSEMEIISKTPVLIPDTFSYFSLLCVDGDVSDVTISGAKWNLQNAEITTAWQYATSNEVVKGGSATVSAGQGLLLLIKDF